MMGQGHKHLHELLEEDQEPFFLKNYIADKRIQLNRATPEAAVLQAKKRNFIAQSSISRRSLCKQACLFSFQGSPDVRQSPFIDFPSPAAVKSPCKCPNSVLLHVPAGTAAMLLEAAMRIQKQSLNPKPKTQTKNPGFGLLGSILMRLSGKKRSRKGETGGRKSAGKAEEVQENAGKGASEMGFSCSCSSSEQNHSDPSSPFRVALWKSPSSGGRTPNVPSPAASPGRQNKQDNYETEGIEKTSLEEGNGDQCSPVSVLDPPSEEDGNGDGDEEDDMDYHLETSYAIVQRAKQQLLEKLQRFEKLAELDPIELEKGMLQEQGDEDDNNDEGLEEEEKCEEDSSPAFQNPNNNTDRFVREVLRKSGLDHGKVSAEMARLVLDLIAEEKGSQDRGVDGTEAALKRVSDSLIWLKEVEYKTIDMMVELDFRKELEGWREMDRELVAEAAKEIELTIFGLLVEELSEELES
ncbi:uncharacterized protein LOC127787984 [Diospyros lotus]|uniref:uncharacterized protein LOC127787984 n=1 Tax=Diospyros lotus TaxID=55363 RepID=UPI0022569A21|nr:uncharacterized protein LOC127787984 [Diospyros lotus]